MAKQDKYSQKRVSKISVNGQPINMPSPKPKHIGNGLYVGFDSPEQIYDQVINKIKEFEDAKGNYTESQEYELSLFKNDKNFLNYREGNKAIYTALIAKGII